MTNVIGYTAKNLQMKSHKYEWLLVLHENVNKRNVATYNISTMKLEELEEKQNAMK